ncbi:MAG TPA: hypothetical protein VFY71_09705 [Planctomycetota bacterium]|nr:hypothetical protein [Planctomycetota bacterium]
MTVTDELGQFIAYIDNAAGLDLAIPTEGIAGISVAPGDILEIAVP